MRLQKKEATNRREQESEIYERGKRRNWVSRERERERERVVVVGVVVVVVLVGKKEK